MILAALALAAAPAAMPAAAVAEIFAPYRQAAIDSGAAWDRPIFTPQLRALIAKWRAVTPSDEVDDLSDFDWLCQCQDWDAHAFRASVLSLRKLGPDRVEVRVAIRLDRRTTRQAQLVLQLHRRRWLIDEMVTPDFKSGLRAAIKDATAADIALQKHR